MKPSERIRELFNTYDDDSYMFAIMDYLDETYAEQAEKKETLIQKRIKRMDEFIEGYTKTEEEVLNSLPFYDIEYGACRKIREAIKKLYSN